MGAILFLIKLFQLVPVVVGTKSGSNQLKTEITFLQTCFLASGLPGDHLNVVRLHSRRSEKLGPELNVNGVAHPPPPYSQFNNGGFAAVLFNLGFHILIWLLVRSLVVHNLSVAKPKSFYCILETFCVRTKPSKIQNNRFGSGDYFYANTNG